MMVREDPLAVVIFRLSPKKLQKLVKFETVFWAVGTAYTKVQR